jgi:hypothetical protein
MLWRWLIYIVVLNDFLCSGCLIVVLKGLFCKVLLLTPFYLFVVLGLELRVFTLSHSTSPIFVKGFSR